MTAGTDAMNDSVNTDLPGAFLEGQHRAIACDAAADRHAGADPAFMGALATASPPEGWKCELA